MNYFTPDELRFIADFCDSLKSVWDAMIGPNVAGIEIGLDHDLNFELFNVTGDRLGAVTWGESGAVFYPAEPE